MTAVCVQLLPVADRDARAVHEAGAQIERFGRAVLPSVITGESPFHTFDGFCTKVLVMGDFLCRSFEVKESLSDAVGFDFSVLKDVSRSKVFRQFKDYLP